MSLVKKNFALLLLLALTGCSVKLPFSGRTGGGGSNSTGGGNASGSLQGIPTAAFQDKPYSYTITSLGAGYTYSLQNAPSWLTVDATTGRLSGMPEAPSTAANIIVTATKGSEQVSSGPFTITVTGDPMTTQAWHLGNSGQNTFAKNPGVAGEDMKAKEALQSGVTGAGIKVGVSDTGMQILHPDLRDNASLALSKNYAGAAPYLGGDPSPAANGGGDHGTSVSGIIAARAWNGIGARGIAPEAVISAFNFIPNQAVPGVILDQATGSYDVFNQSWGSGFNPGNPIFYTNIDDNYRAILKSTATTGRNGRGAIVLRAAGNDYQARAVPNTNPVLYRQRPANGEEDNAIPWVLVIGAMNARGKRASYSSTGPSLWVSGTAGEFGNTDPATLTTDVMGCTGGYSRSNLGTPANPFELGQQGNSNCDYTTIFNGTSSATPSVAGVVALMLSANPNLTFRDVKHILAKTATKVDTTYTEVRYPLDPANYISEPNWILNKANYNFHNWYGFGRANAQAAVAMAKNYTSTLGTLLETVNGANWKYDKNVNLAINDNNAAAPSATDTIAVSESWIIEAIQIKVSVTHPMTGDLGVELISPQGTKSILVTTNNAFSTANWTNITLLSNAFYGENSAGNWTLRVIDGAAGNTGNVTNWKINVLGHNP